VSVARCSCECVQLFLSRKTVSFSFSEPYDFVPSFLGNLEIPATIPSSRSDEKIPVGSQHTTGCSLFEYLRTYFSKKSVLETDDDWVSPHPSPQGDTIQSEKTLALKELNTVLPSASPPTALVSVTDGSRPSASTDVTASGKPKLGSHADSIPRGGRNRGSQKTGSREAETGLRT
jgi:hypothetical protein